MLADLLLAFALVIVGFLGAEAVRASVRRQLLTPVRIAGATGQPAAAGERQLA